MLFSLVGEEVDLNQGQNSNQSQPDKKVCKMNVNLHFTILFQKYQILNDIILTLDVSVLKITYYPGLAEL